MKAKQLPPAAVIPDIPFTAEAYQKLRADFERLSTERKAVMVRLQTAREMGDLSENGAYIYAKMELGTISRQLAQLKHLLHYGKVIQKQTTQGVVQFGSTVTLQHGSRKVVYMLVSMYESNLTEHKLSMDSPLGQAMLGRNIGDEVIVKTPTAEVTYTILEIA